MKLFVDDQRPAPEGWVLARTITEAIRILCTQDVEEVSLDHDIGCRLVTGQEHSSNETFEAVAWFLALADPEVYKIRIHTANIAAGRRMAEILSLEYNNEIYDPANYLINQSPSLTPGDQDGIDEGYRAAKDRAEGKG